MIAITGTLKVKGFPTKRKMQTHIRQSLRSVAENWHEEMLPDHFNFGASQKYSYRQRSEPYNKKKERMAQQGRALKGGKVDLVFTGLLEQAATGFSTIRATPKRSVVRLAVPSYTRYHAKYAEITSMTANELSALDTIARKEMEQGLNSDSTGGTTRRIR